jgi:hypothetical protein
MELIGGKKPQDIEEAINVLDPLVNFPENDETYKTDVKDAFSYLYTNFPTFTKKQMDVSNISRLKSILEVDKLSRESFDNDKLKHFLGKKISSLRTGIQGDVVPQLPLKKGKQSSTSSASPQSSAAAATPRTSSSSPAAAPVVPPRASSAATTPRPPSAGQQVPARAAIRGKFEAYNAIKPKEQIPIPKFLTVQAEPTTTTQLIDAVSESVGAINKIIETSNETVKSNTILPRTTLKAKINHYRRQNYTGSEKLNLDIIVGGKRKRSKKIGTRKKQHKRK